MNHRGLFFLGIALLVTALVLAIITGLITPEMVTRRSHRSAPVPPPTVGGGQNARAAFEQVMAWAETQNLALEPLSISTTSRRGEPASRWTLQLYQTEKKKLWIVSPTAESVQVLREQTALYAQHPFDPAVWTVDSDAVVESWWVQSGQAAWSEPAAHSLSLHLGPNGDGALVWTVTVIDQESKVLDLFRMNAETGEQIPLSRG